MADKRLGVRLSFISSALSEGPLGAVGTEGVSLTSVTGSKVSVLPTCIIHPA